MIAEVSQSLLDPALATPGAAAIALGLAALWLLGHVLKGRASAWPLRLFFFACRTGVGALVIWLTASLAARHFTLGFVMPLWSIALFGVCVVELLVALSAYDRRLLQRHGLWILALRLGAVTWLLVALLEPLAIHSSTRSWQREVAVIIDDSESMQVIDERVDPGYALEVAALFGREIAQGRPRFDRLADELRAVADSLQRGSNGLFDERVLREVGQRLRDIPAGLDEFDAGLRGKLLDRIETIEAAQRSGDASAIERVEASLGEALGDAMVKLGQTQEEAERAYLANLDEAQRREIELAGNRSRAEIARHAVTSAAAADGRDLIEALRRDYKVHFYFAGSDLLPADRHHWVAPDARDGFREQTDLGGALDAVLRAVPPKLLAGAIVASDGANNSGIDIDGPVRGFALRKAPIGAIVLGGTGRAGAIDAAITGVHAPRKVVLGKPLRIEVALSLQNTRGRRATLVLREDGVEIDRRPLQANDPYQRMSLVFDHLPELSGVREYEVQVELEGPEQIVANNLDMARVRVLEDDDEVDALNVLLIDTFPRWEFRYLRNLFDGRDESVRLQHLLFRPEAVHGVAPLPVVAASTARPFGDSRAGALPATPAEWSAFQVIIVGDVATDHLGAEQWAIIEERVDSGALLVVLAGKQWMPHLVEDKSFAALAPARYQPGLASPPPSEMLPYRIRWTPAGMESQLDRLSADPDESQSIWSAVPPIRWRHPVAEVKAGAEVLAYAAPIDGELGAAEQGADLDRFAERNALVITHRYGKGRVVAMHFDRSYRLRFGFGERFHHRFWWQLIHWKASQDFALDSLVEIKLDREDYEFGMPVQVLAKAIDSADEVLPGPLSIKVIDTGEGDDNGDGSGVEVLRQTLMPRVGGHGVFEATLRDLPGGRNYEAVLEGESLDALSEKGDTPTPVPASVKFKIQPAKPIELQDLSPHPEVLGRVASRTGGRVASLGDAHSLAAMFGVPVISESTRTENFLWDRPQFLIVFVILLAAEWILRRQAGLP